MYWSGPIKTYLRWFWCSSGFRVLEFWHFLSIWLAVKARQTIWTSTCNIAQINKQLIAIAQIIALMQHRLGFKTCMIMYQYLSYFPITIWVVRVLRLTQKCTLGMWSCHASCFRWIDTCEAEREKAARKEQTRYSWIWIHHHNRNQASLRRLSSGRYPRLCH